MFFLVLERKWEDSRNEREGEGEGEIREPAQSSSWVDTKTALLYRIPINP